jgi:hypothetical protein
MASARVDPLFRIGAGSNLDLAADVAAKQAVRIAIGQNVTIKVNGIEDASGSIEPFLRLSIRRRKWDRCGLRLRTIRCCGRRFATKGSPVGTGFYRRGQNRAARDDYKLAADDFT